MSDQRLHTPPDDNNPAPLSPAGLERRDAILTTLQNRLARRRLRRRASRIAGASLALLALAAAAFFLTHRHTPAPSNLTPHPAQAHHHPPSPPPLPSPAPPAPDNHAPVIITITGPAHIRPCHEPRAPGSNPEGPTVCLLSDEQLLAALAETGGSYGLVRIGDRVEVVTNHR